MKSLLQLRFIPLQPDIATLVLRLAFGIFMLNLHGYGKWMRWDEISVDFAEPFGLPSFWSAALTIFAEVICAGLIVLGLFTRLACIPLIICMAVAAFKIHAGDPWGDKEGSMTYMAAYLAILFLGPGKYSLDALIFKNK